MPDNFEFLLVSDFKGYNSSRDKTNLADGFLVRGSQNVYKKLSGTIASRPGLLRRGTADATAAGVLASYEWYTSLGATLPLRVANNKLQVESDVSGDYVWYDLLITSSKASPAATLTRFVMDPWWDNTEKKDLLVMVRGDANLLTWSGGITKVASATTNTITKDGTNTWGMDGFTNTAGKKKIMIGGVEYTYTGGESTTTLTGVTPDASGLVADDVVVQAVFLDADKPAAGNKNDFIKVIGNRLHVGSYTSRLIYISDDSDYTDFTVPGGGRAPGDPELLTLDNTAKGITVRNGNAHISAGTSDWYEISYSQMTVSTTLTEQTKVDKKPSAVLQAAYAHEFIDTVGNDIVYLSQDQQLRVLGTFRNLFQAKYPCLSQAVYDELAQEDFTGGALRAIGDFIYITAPNNGRDWMHQTRESVDANGNITAERLWHPPQIRNVSRFAVIDGVVYGHSNANPQIYQVWDTEQWHDDGPSDESLPYDCIMRMAYKQGVTKNGVRRQGLIAFNMAYFEGYVSPGVDLNANIYIDYQGSTSSQNVNINSIESPTKLFISSSPLGFGTVPFGTNPLGDGVQTSDVSQELLPKFRAICGVNPADCFEYSLEVYTTEVNSRWEILALGVNVVEQEFSATFIRK